MFEVTATGHAIDSYRFVPARVRDGVATPSPPGPEADDALLFWDNLRGCTDLTP